MEDARQEERQYDEYVLTHQRQQLAHIFSQRRPSALDLGGVDVATEKLLEGGGLGAEMVRTERDLAAAAAAGTYLLPASSLSARLGWRRRDDREV